MSKVEPNWFCFSLWNSSSWPCELIFLLCGNSNLLVPFYTLSVCLAFAVHPLNACMLARLGWVEFSRHLTSLSFLSMGWQLQTPYSLEGCCHQKLTHPTLIVIFRHLLMTYKLHIFYAKANKIQLKKPLCQLFFE